MTAELERIIAKTTGIFDRPEEIIKPSVPEPSISWKRKLEALETAGLERQRRAAVFDMRCEQAEAMGFEHVDSDDLVKMLMGDEHTDTAQPEERQNYEYTYDHHIDKVLDAKDNWGGNPQDFWLTERKGVWYLPPFAKREVWRCRFGKLDYLKRDIPYPVVLRINEVKELKLFNVFNVLAPMEAWERETDIDPIVVATIWELPPADKDGKFFAGQTAHFFLAQWE